MFSARHVAPVLLSSTPSISAPHVKQCTGILSILGVSTLVPVRKETEQVSSIFWPCSEANHTSLQAEAVPPFESAVQAASPHFTSSQALPLHIGNHYGSRLSQEPSGWNQMTDQDTEDPRRSPECEASSHRYCESHEAPMLLPPPGPPLPGPPLPCNNQDPAQGKSITYQPVTRSRNRGGGRDKPSGGDS